MSTGAALEAAAEAVRGTLVTRVLRRDCGAPALLLLGTDHGCARQALLVERAVHLARPRAVGLELCAARLRRLCPAGSVSSEEARERLD